MRRINETPISLQNKYTNMIFKEQEYTRVSTILNPISGYGMIEPMIIKMAQDRGTIVHRLIEDYLRLGIEDENCQYSKYFDSFKKFWGEIPEQQQRSIYTLEQRLYDDDLLLTGQSDVILSDGTLIDWKTSSAVNRTWPLQASAYAHLCDLNGFHINKILFVKLDKEGKKPKFYEYTKDFALFMKCYEFYHLFFKNMKPLETDLI